MRCLSFPLLFTLLFLSPFVLSESKDERDIQALFSHYMAKYNHYIHTGELDRSPELYRDTVLVMSDSRSPNTVDKETFYQQVQVFLDGLKARGVTHVSWGVVKVHMLGDKLALASNIAVRMDDKDTVIDRVGASYYLFKQPEGWRIAAFSVHPVDNSFDPIPLSPDQGGQRP